MKTNRILAVHLLNDFSGSPFVFSQALQTLANEGAEVHLYTATPSGNGFLNAVSGITHHPIFYKWSPNKWVTLLLFCWSQFTLFLRILFTAKATDIVYVNSMLPFGAALAGKLKGAKVLYHIHEISIQPALLKKFLLGVVNLTASRAVFVSEYLQEVTPVKSESTVIYNALPEEFIAKAGGGTATATRPFTVLMLCSLKKYKGVDVFVRAANTLPALQFQLVLNADKDAVTRYFEGISLPANLTLHPAQQDVHPFYRSSDLVVNLSLPDQWVETFGMTVLEAMVYGKPLIVPPVGGVAELVREGIEGFRVDSRNEPALHQVIQLLASDTKLYREMSLQSAQRASHFSSAAFSDQIVKEVSTLRNCNRIAQPQYN